jgi:protein TonB
VPPEPAPDEEIPKDEEPPKQEDLKDKVIATATVEGNTTDADIVIEEPREETKAVEIQKEEIFMAVEQAPAYPGGMGELSKFLQRNLKYPRQASTNNIEGSVYVQFVVDSHGKISDVKILKGVGYGCDEEAERVVKAMPAWAPGKQGGRAVSVRYSLPIKFKLAQ